MKTKHVRPVLVESKDIHSQLEIDTISIGKLSYEAKQYHCKHPQELILISLEDEKIEVGNEYLDDCVLIREAVTSDEDYWKRRPDYKKVIARQSQISPEYISKFVKQYNQDCIEDLEIEMEYFENDTLECIGMDGEPNCVLFNGFTPKLANGFVTIVEKELITYTENDMRDAFEAGHKLGWSGYPNTDNWTQPKFEEWFDKNKKK